MRLEPEIRRKLRHFLVHILPRAIIYMICAAWFFNSVIPLVKHFTNYDTNVLVHYEVPKNIVFPAFTVCGCCLTQIMRQETAVKVFRKEYRALQNQTVWQIFNQHSYRERMLLNKCEFARDARKHQKWTIECKKISPVVESIHSGRKCFTYLSDVFDNQKRHGSSNESDDRKHGIENSQRFTSYLKFEVSFPGWENAIPSDTLMDADVIMGFHGRGTLPSMLDIEFYRLDPGGNYQAQFKIQKTNLRPPPYRTMCHNYSQVEPPRSNHECMLLCILNQTVSNEKCINYYTMVTRGMLRHLRQLHPNIFHTDLRFCPTRSYLSYYRFVVARRQCQESCARNCIELAHSITMDAQAIDPTYEQQINYSTVTITSNRDMFQTVDHESELNTFELIGCLGGHAHIWLGLSSIQFYLVVESLIRRARFLLERFWFGRIPAFVKN